MLLQKVATRCQHFFDANTAYSGKQPQCKSWLGLYSRLQCTRSNAPKAWVSLLFFFVSLMFSFAWSNTDIWWCICRMCTQCFTFAHTHTYIYINRSANFFLIEVITECWVDLPWYTCVLVNYVFYTNCLYLLIPTSLFIPSLYLSPCIMIILLCSFVSLFLFGPLLLGINF